MSKLKSYVEEFQFEKDNLIVYTIGCPMGIADGEKMINRMYPHITEPTIIILVCNVVEWHEMLSRKRITELRDKYPQHKLFITGCVNEIISEKFKKLGKIIYKKDMWNPESYKVGD